MNTRHLATVIGIGLLSCSLSCSDDPDLRPSDAPDASISPDASDSGTIGEPDASVDSDASDLPDAPDAPPPVCATDACDCAHTFEGSEAERPTRLHGIAIDESGTWWLAMEYAESLSSSPAMPLWGVSSSDDRGVTWRRRDAWSGRVGEGARAADLVVWGDAIVVAGHSEGEDGQTSAIVRRSVDRGATWQVVDDVADAQIHPEIGLTRLANGHLLTWGTVRGDDGAESRTYLRKSTDGGATWSAVGGELDGSIAEIEEAPDGALWLVTERPAYTVRRSTDGGATWTVVDDTVADADRTSGGALFIDGDTIYSAGTAFDFTIDGSFHEDGLFLRTSADAGRTWSTEWIASPPDHEIRDVADVLRAADGALYAFGEGPYSMTILRREGGVWSAVVDTWADAASTELGGVARDLQGWPVAVSSQHQRASSAGIIHHHGGDASDVWQRIDHRTQAPAAIFPSGFVRVGEAIVSSGYEATKTPEPLGLLLDRHPEGIEFTLVTRATRDGGCSWTEIDRRDGLLRTGPDLVTAFGDGLAHVVRPVGGEARVALRRSLDGGESWAELPAPPELEDPIALTADEQARLFLVGSTEAAVNLYRSDDAGETWTLVDEGISERTFEPHDIAVDAEGRIVLSGVDEGSDPAWRYSPDDGATWQTFVVPAPPGAIDNLPHRVFTVDGALISLANQRFNGRIGTTVYRSSNGGITWSEVYSHVSSDVSTRAFDLTEAPGGRLRLMMHVWNDEGSGLHTRTSIDRGRTWGLGESEQTDLGLPDGPRFEPADAITFDGQTLLLGVRYDELLQPSWELRPLE